MAAHREFYSPEGTIYLRTFTADELVLDENETRQALAFFFPADSATM